MSITIEAIKQLIDEAIKQSEKRIIEAIQKNGDTVGDNIINTQSLIATISTKVDNIQTTSVAKKTKAPKTTEGAEGKQEVAAVEPVGKTTMPNKMNYFKQRYHDNDPAFRKEIDDALAKVDPGFAEKMGKDKAVLAKKEGTERWKAQASYIWIAMRDNGTLSPVLDLVTKYHEEKKKSSAVAIENSGKVEEHTPKKV